MPPTFDENTMLLWHILETQKTKPEVSEVLERLQTHLRHNMLTVGQFDFAAVGAKMGLSTKTANMRFYRFKKAMERKLGDDAKTGVGEASGTAGSAGDEAKKGGKGAKRSKKRKQEAVEDDAEDRVSVVSDQTVTGGDEEV